MNVTFEKTGDARGIITVNIEKADYASKVDEKLKEIGKTHVIPGFRKGHIAMPELRKRFGRDVKSDAINRVVIDAVFDYIEKNNIKVIGQPLPHEKKEIDLKEDNYTFQYDIALWPDTDIKLDKEVKLPFYLIDVTEEMVAEQDKALCERFGSQEPGEEVDAKAVVKGSIMQLDENGAVRTDEDAIQVTAGIVAPFLFHDKDEEAKFIGKHINDKVVFNPFKAAAGNAAELASMLNIDKEKAAEVKSDFEFAISEIIVVKLAAHGQDLYDDVFGKDKVHTEEEYLENIKKMIQAQLFPNTISLSNRDIHDYLIETYADKVVVDTELLKKWILLNNEGATVENVDKDFESMLPGIKWELISGTITDKLDVKVTEDDLKAQATFIARQQLQQYGMYNMDVETIEDMGKRILADEKIRRQIYQQVEESKLFNAIREAITLDEKTVSLEEFKKIANPSAE
ncbi:MAG: hypothetical protein NC405_02610 [Odoribacter sp.]|nr:hypothetical protein [Odoribacter sp.]